MLRLVGPFLSQKDCPARHLQKISQGNYILHMSLLVIARQGSADNHNGVEESRTLFALLTFVLLCSQPNSQVFKHHMSEQTQASFV